MDKQRWANVGLGALAVLAVVMVVLAMTKQRDATVDAVGAPPAEAVASETSPSASAASSAAQQPTATPTPTATATPTPSVVDGPRAVFLGDSYTAGVVDGETTWAGIVSQKQGWNATNLARGGTGYVTALTGAEAQQACGLDTCPAYRGMVSEAAKADPDIIMVSGGRFDGEASVTNAAATLYLDLAEQAPGARIIAVSPLWDDDPVPADLTGTKQGVRVAASRAGVEYIDIGQPLTGRSDLVGDDGIHPNAAGQRAIAEAVLAELE